MNDSTAKQYDCQRKKKTTIEQRTGKRSENKGQDTKWSELWNE